MSDEPRGKPPAAGPGAPRKDSGPSGAEYAGFGLQFVAALLLFLYLGQWLDGRLGTTPWLMIIGMFLGAGASFYSMYRKLMAAQAREDEARREAKEAAARERERQGRQQ